MPASLLIVVSRRLTRKLISFILSCRVFGSGSVTRDIPRTGSIKSDPECNPWKNSVRVGDSSITYKK